MNEPKVVSDSLNISELKNVSVLVEITCSSKACKIEITHATSLPVLNDVFISTLMLIGLA